MKRVTKKRQHGSLTTIFGVNISLPLSPLECRLIKFRLETIFGLSVILQALGASLFFLSSAHGNCWHWIREPFSVTAHAFNKQLSLFFFCLFNFERLKVKENVFLMLNVCEKKRNIPENSLTLLPCVFLIFHLLLLTKRLLSRKLYYATQSWLIMSVKCVRENGALH